MLTKCRLVFNWFLTEWFFHRWRHINMNILYDFMMCVRECIFGYIEKLSLSKRMKNNKLERKFTHFKRGAYRIEQLFNIFMRFTMRLYRRTQMNRENFVYPKH